MHYSTLQASKAWTRHLSVLLFAFSLLFGPLLQAQSPPVEAWFTPGEFESGDELTLHIDYGSMEIPVDPATEISLTFAYEGFDITSQPTMDVTDSWFCEDGNCDATIEVFAETRELKVTISRTNGVAVGGFGRLGKGKGIIIEMDDVHMKKENQKLLVLNVESKLNLSQKFTPYYNSWEQKLYLSGLSKSAPYRLSIIGIDGTTILVDSNSDKVEREIVLGQNRIYLILVQQGQESWTKKIWVE